jgi:hypothetical protein
MRDNRMTTADRTKGTEQTPLGVISALYALSVIWNRLIDLHENVTGETGLNSSNATS